MKAAIIFAGIGLIGGLYGLLDGIMNDKPKMWITNFIFVCVDIFVILFANSRLNETPNMKYKVVDDVVCVNVDSLFTKTKMGVDTTYTIHYVCNPYWAASVEYNVKHLEIDSVFIKTNKCVDTTYVIKYSKK